MRFWDTFFIKIISNKLNFFYTIKNYIFFYKFQFRRYIFSNQKNIQNL
ncbi:hypothetical protein LEP1GSC037_3981 [Leptospira interrogans str. 2006001854]|uniref:Uncharacterized protein n=1 Tax=Leptospira interrogans str. 2006001854 TaxID=1001590 RepID=M6GG95_LEPIR|nr:hypothetical protein LEP1GSC037_3981 [Leptospira interrogans str. 2006001854]